MIGATSAAVTGPGAAGWKTASVSDPSRHREPEHTATAGAVVEREGAGEPRLRTIVSGWAGCVRHLPCGRRQLVAFVLPGEACGGIEARPGVAAWDLLALTPLRWRDHGPREALQRDPDGAILVRSCAEREARVLLAHVVRLDQLAAPDRTLDGLAELQARSGGLGARGPDWVRFPIRQGILKDYLGLSAPHLCRVLRRLRREGWLEIAGGRMRLPRAASAYGCSQTPPRAEARTWQDDPEGRCEREPADDQTVSL